MIPMPLDVSDLDEIKRKLNAATHEQRLRWARSLNGKQQLKLYALAAGDGRVTASELCDTEEMVIYSGRNGLALFNLFQKRFATIQGEQVGYNKNEFPALIAPLVGWITGPGHYTFYDSPEVPGEVWIDYRTVGSHQHPAFPPLVDNESGTRQLVFGNMVDVLRRVSRDVFIGDAFKDKPRDTPPPLLTRLASAFPTAPFVLCRDPT